MIKLSDVSKIYSSKKILAKWFDHVRGKTPAGKDMTVAVNGISLEIADNQVIGLIGPNGAGKTTLVKLLTGLLFPTAGSVSVDELVPADLKPEFKKKIALFRSDLRQMDEGVLVLDNYEEKLSVYGCKRLAQNEYAEKIIEQLAIRRFLERLPESLSLGERMLCEIVFSLLHEPKVIFLDEPTVGLDVLAVGRFENLVEYLKSRGCTILITSHDLHSVVSLADRLILINSGKVILDGSPEKILDEASDECTIKLELTEEPERPLIKENMSLTYPSLTVESSKKNLAADLSELLSKFKVHNLKVIEPPLQSVFSKYYERDSE
jgi:ABC-2 type transport system ATP-binding protein